MRLTIGFLLAALATASAQQSGGGNVFSVSGDQLLLNGKPFKVVGLRTSNALISDATTQQLIDQLDVFKSYGVNTVSVFIMGSRFGDVKGYRPDATLDPTYAARLAKIIKAADARGIVVLVGCLYWSTSRAKEDLGAWTQTEANRAVANTVRWLKDNNFRNVFVDPDNEGMAHDAKGWSIAQMIDAAHAVDPTIMVGYNDSAAPPSNADLYMHHSPKVSGKPWIESEGSVGTPLGGYWGTYSKETHQNTGGSYYNYSRIGRYTSDMKTSQINAAKSTIEKYNGYMMASTWLQCVPNEGVGGPFQTPGGRSNIADVNQDIDKLHPDAGVLWWLEAMKAAYGAWTAPSGGGGGGGGGGARFLEQGGELVIEAEHYATKSSSTYTGYTQVHAWEFKTDVAGYSGDGFMHVLPDERGEDAVGPSSPRDNSGAEMTYPIRISAAGTYYVWVRGYSMGGESNGVHLGVDGAIAGTGPGASNMSGFRPHLAWVWESARKDGYAQPATLSLTAGDHTLHVWNRDDGFRIDKIYLTTSSTAAPTGQGPAESSTSGGTSGGGGSGEAVDTFTLINADTDLPLAGFDPLLDGAVLNLGTLPTRNLSIRANTVPSTVGSVRFAYDGNSNYRTENVSPYAIAGDDPQGNYNPWTPAVGPHTLTATPYSGSNASGTAGTSQTISFTVLDDPSTTSSNGSSSAGGGQGAGASGTGGGRDNSNGDGCGALGLEVLLVLLAGSFRGWR